MQEIITEFCYRDTNLPQRLHHHLSFELIFVVGGEAEFVIEDKSYKVSSGSIVMLNSFEKHELKILKEPYLRYFLTLNASLFEKNQLFIANLFRNRPQGFLNCVNVIELEKMKFLWEQLYYEYKNNWEHKNIIINNLLEQIFITIYRSNPSNFKEEIQSKCDLNAVRLYIEENFRENLKVSDLSQKFYVSTCYLTHRFKEQVGYSPKQYLQLNRLSYAKQLLQSTDLQISEISYKCGFQDSNNFIRCFTSYYKISPGQFRKSIK